MPQVWVGLKLWKFVYTALTVLCIVDTEAETGAPFSTQLEVLLLAAIALVLQMQLHPQMFTFVMLGALLALLTRDNYRGYDPLWLAVPLMALWANLHGGWVIGIGTLGLCTAVALFCDLTAGQGWRRRLRLAAFTLCSLNATLLNPTAWFVARSRVGAHGTVQTTGECRVAPDAVRDGSAVY
jgi:hypothetical protein